MIKYLLLILLNFSFANADECSPQFKEYLKANKEATFINCFIVNNRPLTAVVLQIFPIRDTEPSGVTLSAYLNAHLFRHAPDQVITRLGEVILPFKVNDKVINRGLLKDVDKDGQDEIVFTSLIPPKVSSVYIFGWDKEVRALKAKSSSKLHEKNVDFMAGSYLPATDYEFPQLDTNKKTLLMPYETYGENHNTFSYKNYKLGEDSK